VRVVALVIIQILQFTFVVQRFFATREFFGTGAALFALIIASFDPNLLAHSALVTIDMGVICFFLASIYTFYRLRHTSSASSVFIFVTTFRHWRLL
jgi:4-amino-4-deoxy-L-arabinose transferase-like glycosyltransferase